MKFFEKIFPMSKTILGQHIVWQVCYNKRFLYHIITSTKCPKMLCEENIQIFPKLVISFYQLIFGFSKSNELGLTDKFVAFSSFRLIGL